MQYDAAFLVLAFVVVVFLLWRSRRGGTGDTPPVPLAGGDRPAPSISNESSLGPRVSLGRPWRADQGDAPPGDGGNDS